MGNIHLYTDSTTQLTSVSNIFIDEFMPEANGEFVKVYLYLLRCIGSNAQNCTISAIADLFMHTEKDILRALKYWEKQGVLALDFDSDNSVCGIHFTDFTANEKVTPAKSSSKTMIRKSIDTRVMQNSGSQVSENPVSDKPVIDKPVIDKVASEQLIIERQPAKKEYTLDDIKNFRKDPDVSELFFIIEAYLKHPLTATDTNTVLYWYDELDFTTELIDYLVEYCISKGHSSFKYMDKVALGWAENKITTVEQAKENAAIHSQIYYSVMKALGISGRNLVDSEMEYIRKWTKDYAFDNSIILDACNRTISATHQPSFEYTDSILTNWNKNNVHTLDDIKRLDEAFSKTKKIKVDTTEQTTTVRRNKFNNFSQRNQDYDQLEKLLLNSSVQ